MFQYGECQKIPGEWITDRVNKSYVVGQRW